MSLDYFLCGDNVHFVLGKSVCCLFYQETHLESACDCGQFRLLWGEMGNLPFQGNFCSSQPPRQVSSDLSSGIVFVLRSTTDWYELVTTKQPTHPPNGPIDLLYTHNSSCPFPFFLCSVGVGKKRSSLGVKSPLSRYVVRPVLGTLGHPPSRGQPGAAW